MKQAHAPVLIILAGPNGSGKTTFSKHILQHDWGKNCCSINADAIANELGDWNNPKCVQQAQTIARERLAAALKEKENILFETVFSHPSKLELIQQARQIGYFIRLFFICTQSPRINIDRVAERFSRGGHQVPGDKISGRYNRSLLYGASALRMVQRGYFYDNTEPAITSNTDSFRLIFRTIEGEQYKLYTPIDSLPLPYSYFLRDFLTATENQS